MTTEATETISIRQQVREATPEEFAKAHTKAELVELAVQVQVAADLVGTAKTKADLVTLIYGKYPPPDPALRGNSTIPEPVAYVWQHAETRFAEYRADPDNLPKPRRCDVIEECKAAGVTHFTAKTQYQCWFKHTMSGKNAITGRDGLPKKMADLLYPVEEKVDATTA